MSTTLFNALSALQTHQRAMNVTSHNIANANTPGYSRQQAVLSTNVPQMSRPGPIGRGVQLSLVQRVNDQFVDERLRQVQTEGGRLRELETMLSNLEMTFNEPSDAGFAATVNRFFAALEDLSNNPESNATRSGTIGQLQTFTTLVNDVARDLSQQQQSAGATLHSLTRDVNRITQQLAELNIDIRRGSAAGTPPNDLIDTRDELLRELSTMVQVGVRYQPDYSVQVDLGGRLLVGSASSTDITTEQVDDGKLAVVFADDRGPARLSGGRLQAMAHMRNEVLPGIIADFDKLAVSMMRQMNGIHATGSNATARPQAVLGNMVIPGEQLNTNLDDPILQQETGHIAGIPAGMLAEFVDDMGNPQATNLTINMLNTVTGMADKYTVRYEPGGVPAASRSLNDLISAINTGRGGGFSVHPPVAGGIPNLKAHALSVDGGHKLSLQAADGYAIDFSRSLDIQPARGAWTGGGIDITGVDADLAGKRLHFEITDSGMLEAYTIHPQTGNREIYDSVALPNPAPDPLDPPLAIGGLFVTFSGAANDYVAGQSFTADFTSAGNLVGGDLEVRAHWRDDAASVSIHGRYTGNVSMIPNQPWNMSVLKGGTIGSQTDAPMVKFTYNVGDGSGAAEQRTMVITLDDHYPPGTQIPIADGVYAVFEDGLIFEDVNGSNNLDFTVDGQPDQAGLLSALGVQSLFQGGNAATMQVSEGVLASPNNLLVGSTRSSGDNSNVLRMLDTRQEKLLDGDSLSFEDFYQDRLNRVATQVNQVAQQKSNQAAVQASLENRRDQISGVNIDEEVGMLIMQQQAYQAAARIVGIERENIQALLGILG